ncbi:MAG: Hsp20/alpha crystallin family protein [Lentimicrobiaceae bacterium]|nr:Hsp20/alpha crystallin family protein [Lentimicrobiaceae bacterium]
MTLVRFNQQPALADVIDQIFYNQNRQVSGCGTPVNIYKTDDSFVIELAVPGYSKEEISINLEQQTLKISAEAKQRDIKDDKFLRREFGFNGINRSFVLPKTIDTETISADFRDGILKINLLIKQETLIKKEISIS